MKRFRFIIPASLIILVAAVWYAHQASEAASLRNELDSLHRTRAQGGAAAAIRSSAASDEASQLAREIVDLKKTLAEEEASMRAAEKSLAAIQSKIPTVGEGEVVVSFGRIADMGQEAAQAIRAISALFEPRKGSLVEKERMQASFMKLIAWMPEIADFEEQPAEIACFQTAVLRELFELDESRAGQMESIIKQHFTALHAGGLTASNSSQPNWRERRSAVLTPLLWQLRPFIPTNFKSPGVLSQIVNVGAGMETKSETRLSNEPGKSSHAVSMSLPSWPRLPWLPAKTDATR